MLVEKKFQLGDDRNGAFAFGRVGSKGCSLCVCALKQLEGMGWINPESMDLDSCHQRCDPNWSSRKIDK